jgi:hypothetical protein
MINAPTDPYAETVAKLRAMADTLEDKIKDAQARALAASNAATTERNARAALEERVQKLETGLTQLVDTEPAAIVGAIRELLRGRK